MNSIEVFAESAVVAKDQKSGMMLWVPMYIRSCVIDDEYLRGSMVSALVEHSYSRIEIYTTGHYSDTLFATVHCSCSKSSILPSSHLGFLPGASPLTPP
jgi:hypothetical protein